MIDKIKKSIKKILGIDVEISELKNDINLLKNKNSILAENNIELLSSLQVAENKNEELFGEIERLQQNIEELNTKKEAAENQLKKLIEDKKVDVNEVKDWYENRFGNSSWFRNYDGLGNKDVKTVFEYPTNSKNLLYSRADEIINRYNINLKNTTPRLIIERVKQWFTIKSHWTYISDMINNNVLDFWQKAHISAMFLKGDCEDLAIYMNTLILIIFEKAGLSEYNWRIKLTASNMISGGGHAYNIWLHDDGEWYCIESTYDLEGSFKRTWLKTPIKNNNMYFNFWGFARPDRSFRGNQLASFEKYEVE